MSDSGNTAPQISGSIQPSLETRMMALLVGLIAGALLGGMAGLFWFFLPGMMLGGLCGALIGVVAPPVVGRAMLLGYVVAAPLSLMGLVIWWGKAHSDDWLASPIGSHNAGDNDFFLAWPLSILTGLATTALVGLVIARPWQKRAHRRLGWVGVTATALPLLLPGAGAGWLLAAAREGQAIGQEHDDRMDAQRVAQAQSQAREQARLRAAAQHLAGAFGELHYPRATPPALVADGMSFTCNTTEPLPNIVAYYERLIGHRFRVRPANDGGSALFYNDVVTLSDAREVYVYIEPPISPSVAARITLMPV